MDASPKTPDPEYTIIEKSSLVMEVRRRFGREKFEEDLRIFLRVPEKTFRSFLNSKLDLVNALIVKLKGDPNFSQELQKFLEFGDQTENLGKELEETRKKTSEKAQKVLQKTIPPAQIEKKLKKKEKPSPDPEQKKKKEVIDDLLTHGYSFSSSGYFQIAGSIKEARKTKNVQPHEVMEHLWSTTRKRKSEVSLDGIRLQLSKVHIPCELFGKKTPEPLEPGFILTSDGFCILIDLMACTASYDPVKPNV